MMKTTTTTENFFNQHYILSLRVFNLLDETLTNIPAYFVEGKRLTLNQPVPFHRDTITGFEMEKAEGYDVMQVRCKAGHTLELDMLDVGTMLKLTRQLEQEDYTVAP